MSDFNARRRTMVDTQVRVNDVNSFPVIDAMLNVPRELYVPANRRELAYLGENIDLGDDRAILDPRTFAKMLEAVDVTPADLVLDLGCAHGYSTAVLARLAEAVIGVEEDAAMAAEAEATLSDQGVDNAAIIEGPLATGSARHGPFDAIVVGGGVEQMPQVILDQLKDGGRIVAIFNEGRLGEARMGYKVDGRVSWRAAFNAGAPTLPGFEKQSAFVL